MYTIPGVTDNAIQAPEFLQEFITQLILQVQTGSSNELFDQLKVDLAELEKELQTNDAKKIAAILLSDSFELGQCFLEAIKDMKDIIAAKNKANFSEVMKKWEEKIMTKFPNQGGKLVKLLRWGTPLIGLA